MIKDMLIQHVNPEAMDEVINAVGYMIDFAPMVFIPVICGTLLGYSIGVIYQEIIKLYKFYLEWK